jgi:hypothetical protein
MLMADMGKTRLGKSEQKTKETERDEMNKKEGKKKRIISGSSWHVSNQSNENGIPFCH